MADIYSVSGPLDGRGFCADGAVADARPLRLNGIDRLKGFAIAGMILDHVTVFFVGPSAWWRLLLPWTGLPIFTLLCGRLGRPSWRKLLLWFWVGIVLTVFVWKPLHLAYVDILCWLSIAKALQRSRYVFPVLLMSLVQPMSLPLPSVGYQPGSIVAMTLLGAWLVDLSKADRLGRLLPSAFAWLGRWPLHVYVVHLTLLMVLRSLFQTPP